MSDATDASFVVTPDADLRGVASIVGIGHTDYGADWARRKEPATEANTPEAMAEVAFERALVDSGIERDDIDELRVSFLYGGDAPEDVARRLRVTPRVVGRGSGIIAGAVPSAAASIAAGGCDTVALVYAVASRGIGRQYGGATYLGEGRDSYYYYHPWRFSSQAAHWALMFRQYQNVFGATEGDLGSIAVTIRSHAVRNDDAVMRTPLTVEQYLASKYIVRPMHLLDLCLVNDGAVCLIVRRTDMAGDCPHVPVVVAGWADTRVHDQKLAVMVKERLRPQLAEAGGRALDMAGLSIADVDHLEVYDASTIHVVNQLEGLGFVEPGDGLEFCKEGRMTIGGSLPTNTSGGMLSEAYMHGWNQTVEAVRQLRHEAGPRQIDGAEVSLACLATTESAHPVVYQRGNRR